MYLDIKVKQSKDGRSPERYIPVFKAYPQEINDRIKGFIHQFDLEMIGEDDYYGLQIYSSFSLSFCPTDMILRAPEFKIKVGDNTMALLNPFKSRSYAEIHPEKSAIQRAEARMNTSDVAGMAELKVRQLVAKGRRLYLANCADNDIVRMNLLRDAGWLPMDLPKGSAIHQTFSNGLHYTADAMIARPFRRFMDKVTLDALNIDLTHVSQRFKLSSSRSADVKLAEPNDGKHAYFPCQKSCIAIGAKVPGMLIADDMGIGKSAEAIGILNEDPSIRKVLIICEANKKIEWRDKDLAIWERKGLRVGILYGIDNPSLPDCDILIVNQDILAANRDLLSQINWDAIVVDEAQGFINGDAQRTTALIGDFDAGVPGIPVRAGGKKIALSGTPNPNGSASMFMLLSWLDPVLYGRGKVGYEIFARRYGGLQDFQIEVDFRPKGRSKDKAPIKIKKTLTTAKKAIRSPELEIRLRSSLMIRRSKNDPQIAAQLPPKTRQICEIKIDFPNDFEELLKQTEPAFDFIQEMIESDSLPAIRNSERILADGGSGYFELSELQGLKGSVEFSQISRVNKNLAIMMAPIIGNIIRNEIADGSDEKYIILGHHTEALETIVRIINQSNLHPDCAVIYTGKQTEKQKEKAKYDFQNDDRIRVCVMSESGFRGITLTAGSQIVTSDLIYRADVLRQGEDRAWRTGQERPVNVRLFVAQGTTMPRIAKAVVTKMEASDSVVTNRLSEEFSSAQIESIMNFKPQQPGF